MDVGKASRRFELSLPSGDCANTEFGFILEPSPKFTARLAARIEELGFDIMLCPDTQNLCADPYGQLALASAATKKLRLGTGVTNPITRNAAVTASAMASLQIESGGRAICGLGRGDSSAAHIGRANATTAELRRYAQDVQSYLRGDQVLIGQTRSHLRWVDPTVVPPVPVDIACTGPRTIRMAGDVADRVSFAVGSPPERIDWALKTLSQRLEETGRDRSRLSVGAYIILVCDHDEKRAIDSARMISGLIAHFTGLKNAPTEHLPAKLKSLALRLKQEYDMARHNLDTGSHLSAIDDEFVDWFAICGSPQKCIDALGALIEKGLDHIYILGGTPKAESHGARWEKAVEQQELFSSDVLPFFRR
jgi:5,10-methylenetetrahydromethanopterin reductase